MSDPLASTGTLDTPPDPVLQEAAQGLADQLDQTSGGAPESAPPAPEPAAAPSVAPPPRQAIHFGEGVRKFQGGYRGRQERLREELRWRRQHEERFNTARSKDNELLAAAVEALKSHHAVAPEEKIPDPVTDPDGFLAWWAAKQDGALKDGLKPVIEMMQRQEERFAQVEQQRTTQAEEQERQQAIMQQYLRWEHDYQEAMPDLAVGARDRYTTLRDVFARALKFAGVDEPELQEALATRHLAAVAQGADAVGDNGVAAMDSFGYGLYRGFYELVRRDLAMDGINIPPFEDDGTAPAAGPTPAAAPGGYSAPVNGNGGSPAQAETARLQAVRARTAAAGNAAPRVADRGVGAAPSKAIQLYRGGVRDHKALYAACLEEANGVAASADKLMGSLIEEMSKG